MIIPRYVNHFIEQVGQKPCQWLHHPLLWLVLLVLLARQCSRLGVFWVERQIKHRPLVPLRLYLKSIKRWPQCGHDWILTLCSEITVPSMLGTVSRIEYVPFWQWRWMLRYWHCFCWYWMILILLISMICRHLQWMQGEMQGLQHPVQEALLEEHSLVAMCGAWFGSQALVAPLFVSS